MLILSSLAYTNDIPKGRYDSNGYPIGTPVKVDSILKGLDNLAMGNDYKNSGMSEADRKSYEDAVASLKTKLKENNFVISKSINHNTSDASGFAAFAIEPEPNPGGEVTICCRGSDGINLNPLDNDNTLNDWVGADLALAWEDQTKQQEEMKRFMDGMETYQNVTLTGHSLGGNLAMYAAVTFPYPNKVSNVSAFDGPGFNRDFINQHQDEISEIKHKINNYQQEHDFVSSSLISIGNVVILDSTIDYGGGVDFDHHNRWAIGVNSDGELRREETGRKDDVCNAWTIFSTDASNTITDISEFFGTSKGGTRGVVRDFTEATKQRLSGEIDDINKSTWSPVTDAIGDVISYAGKWLGIISLKDDMSNVESYQRTVLDMTNTTKKELEQIFEDVYAIDKEFKGKFAEIVENETAYNDRLKFLFDLIKPNFSICSAATIRKDIGAYDDKLRATSNKTNATFEKEVDWAAKQAALEATKGTISSIFKAAVDLVCLPASMIKNIATGNPIGILTDTWNIIDDVFAVGGNLAGLTVVGIGYGIGALTGSSKVKHEAVKYSEAYGGVSGLTDVLEAEEKVNGEGGFITGMKKVSQTIDAASAAYGLFSDAKDFLENPKKMMDFDFGFKEYEPIKKADMVKEYQDDYRKWQSLYRNYVKDNHVIELKNISNAKDFLDPITGFFTGDDKGEWESVVGGEIAEAFKKSNKWFGALEDAYDLGEDICELFGIAS